MILHNEEAAASCAAVAGRLRTLADELENGAEVAVVATIVQHDQPVPLEHAMFVPGGEHFQETMAIAMVGLDMMKAHLLATWTPTPPPSQINAIDGGDDDG